MRLTRRARRPRAQPPPDARLARAGGRARGRRARRAAPAPVPAGVRDRRVLHARRGVHALPRAQHAAGRAPELPRQPARGGCLRRVAGAVAATPGRAGRRGDRAERVRARAAARARRAAAVGARARAGAAGADARGRGLRAARPASARWAPTRWCVSRLAPEKGVDVAIEACRMAACAGRSRRRAEWGCARSSCGRRAAGWRAWPSAGGERAG